MRRLQRAARRITSCVRLSPWLCFELLFWRAVLPVLKYVLPVRGLARFMWSAPSNQDPTTDEVTDKRQRALFYVWQHGGRLFVSTNCLERSLVLYRLLSRSGSNPSLVMGVNRGESGVAGHAWVEMDGRVFHDETVQGYERLAIFGVNGQPAESGS